MVDGNDIKMYSIQNKGKYVAAERLIRMLKHKIYKHMTVVSKNVYFHALDGIVDKYNNTYDRTIKMKHIDIKSGFYAEYSVDSNAKNAKFRKGDHLRIPKYRNIFAKEYAPNWSQERFVIS